MTGSSCSSAAAATFTVPSEVAPSAPASAAEPTAMGVDVEVCLEAPVPKRSARLRRFSISSSRVRVGMCAEKSYLGAAAASDDDDSSCSLVSAFAVVAGAPFVAVAADADSPSIAMSDLSFAGLAGLAELVTLLLPAVDSVGLACGADDFVSAGFGIVD